MKIVNNWIMKNLLKTELVEELKITNINQSQLSTRNYYYFF